MKYFFIKIIAVASYAVFASTAFASETVGTIDTGFKLAKICQDTTCTSFGNVNWKPTINAMTPGALPVTITDTSITGHIWGDQIGWINLAPTGAGIFVNPSTGVITGKAFATGGSWINFNPTGQSVALVDNGSGSNFYGWAWVSGAYGGWMKFDCGGTGTCVKTDWRSVPNRSTPPSSGGGGGSSSPTVTPTIPVPPIIAPITPDTPITPTTLNGDNSSPQNSKVSENINIFDTDRDGVPDKESNGQAEEIPSTTKDGVTYQKIFPRYQNTFSEQRDCTWCVLVKKRNENKLIKYGFVSEKNEIPIPVPFTKDVETDLPSIVLTVGVGWFMRRIIINLITKTII